MGHILTNARIATLTEASGGIGLIDRGALVVDGEGIAWVGPSTDLPADYAALPSEDLAGGLVTPAFIDCHTHIIHGGHRAREFALRLGGASYQAIAEAGGGIVSTMEATRAAGLDDLVTAALPRLDHLLAEGVAVVEVKSGYGLTIEDEIRMLDAARRLSECRMVRIVTSWLAAHAVPPDYRGRGDAYIDEVAIPGLERAHALGLVDAVDGFCEGIAFSPEQIARVFDAARSLGLPVKLHAEQLSNRGGAALAARFGALSADHLEYLDKDGVAALADAGSVAVLLPGAFYTLREAQCPPVDLLRRAGVPMAVATDCNPGSSPLTSLLLAMNMACTLFRLTPDEALAGVTREAARALGILAESGTIEPGKRADLALWAVDDPAELAYRIGFNPLVRRMFGGVWGAAT